MRDWPDVLSEVSTIDLPTEVTQEVLRRAAEALDSAAQRRGNRHGWPGSWFRSRLVASSCAILGCLLAVGALAFAAHSRRDHVADSNPTTPPVTSAKVLPVDPTTVLAATRVVPIDPAAGWGRRLSGETVFEGLLTKPSTPAVSVGGKWWATVLAVGENVKGGDVLGVGIVRSAGDLNEGKPSFRVAHHGWARAPRKIRAAILAAALREGYRIVKLSLHDTAAGTASVVTVTPAGSQDAIAYLMKHSPLNVPEVEKSFGGSAIFVQVVDADGHVVYLEGSVPDTISVSWVDPRLACRFYSGLPSATTCPITTQ